MPPSTHGFFVEHSPDGAPWLIGRRREGRLDGPVWMARGAPGFPSCADTVSAVLASYRQGHVHGFRFFDATEGERTRAGAVLRDFDLDPLFDAGDVEAFVEDGRYARFLDRLREEDAFLGNLPQSWSFASVGAEDQALFGAAPPRWLRAWREALSKHARRALVGMQPAPGISASNLSPFSGRCVLEAGLDAALVGRLLLEGTGYYPDEVADLVALRGSGALLAVSTREPWRVLGWASLGAVAYASAALTGFEARRVSLAALRRAAAAVQDQVGMEPYLPILVADPEAIPSRTLILRGRAALAPEAEARIAWLRHVAWHREEGDDSLPPLPPRDEVGVDPVTLPDTLYLLARSFLIADDARLAEVLRVARGSASGLLRTAADRVEQHLRGGAPPQGEAARLGGLPDPRSARARLSERWRAEAGEVSPAPKAPDAATPEALADMAWERVHDAIRLIGLREEQLPRFPELDLLLAQVEALPHMTYVGGVAWALREADARPLQPFLAALAQSGAYAAGHMLCRDHLDPWVRAEPRWSPLAAAFARDARYGVQRFRWLTLAGSAADVPWLGETCAALTTKRAQMSEALGFDWSEALSALVSLSPPEGRAALHAALALPMLYPPERLMLAQILVRLGDPAAAPILAETRPPLDRVAMVWPYTAAIIRGVPLFSEREREVVLAGMRAPRERASAELARRLIRASLGEPEPDLGARVVEAIAAPNDWVAEMIEELKGTGALPPEALAAALAHEKVSVRLAALDASSPAPVLQG